MSSPEIKAYLMTLQAQEEQNLEDIRLGLLATLSEYRGFPHIKKAFEDAILNVNIAVGEPCPAGPRK
jgi:hypothetical protein